LEIKVKHFIHLIICAVFVALLNGCASSYWTDRGRDALDIFTGTVGTGVGAKARIGPIQTGVLYQTDYYGLRGGGSADFKGGRGLLFPDNIDLQALLLGGETYLPDDELISLRKKRFDASPDFIFISTVNNYTPCPSYYTQIDIVAALGPSIRLGFNPGELIDFLLGWVGIDIYSDDVEESWQKTQLIRQRNEAIKNKYNQRENAEEHQKSRGSNQVDAPAYSR
jgi:hypothetical protein